MSVLLIVGPKSVLDASHTAHMMSMLTGHTDRQTDGRQTVTLRFTLDAASAIKTASKVECHTHRKVGRVVISLSIALTSGR